MNFWLSNKWKWQFYTCYEWMTQSLQRSKPFSLICMQNLLNEVYELFYLKFLIIGVLKDERQEAMIFGVSGYFSLLNHIPLVLFSF